MTLLIIFAFLAGVVTVLSPCILPLLPIILSSADGSKQKPIGVVIGFIASFTFFTLFLSSIVRLSGISADALRFTSVLVLALFGASLLIPQIQLQIEIFFSRFANRIPSSQKTTGLIGGVVIGISLGVLWTPCVGPILASVISLAITGTVTAQALLITFAYALGTGLPMLAIMMAGSTALQKVPWLVKRTAQIQKGFGVLMILTAVAIFLNVDRRFQTFILQQFPNYGVGLTKFEEIDVIKQQLNSITRPSEQESQMLGKPLSDVNGSKGVPAPALTVGGSWINSPPLQLSALRGKVVLVDFWTYTCINCQRTLPYLRTWWTKYEKDGLVIIGVHSPEFEFEKNLSNVQMAAKDFELTYPIMQDNNFETWKAYENHYWPAKYLIDANGNIRYTHFGEGKYDETERMIQELLKERGSDLTSKEIANPSYRVTTRTPELYLGFARMEYLSSPQVPQVGQAVQFDFPQRLPENSFAFSGTWVVHNEYAKASNGSVLRLQYDAKEVFLVARSSTKYGRIKVILDGQKESAQTITIREDQLYPLVQQTAAGNHTIDIEFLDDTVEVYAFTFG